MQREEGYAVLKSTQRVHQPLSVTSHRLIGLRVSTSPSFILSLRIHLQGLVP